MNVISTGEKATDDDMTKNADIDVSKERKKTEKKRLKEEKRESKDLRKKSKTVRKQMLKNAKDEAGIIGERKAAKESFDGISSSDDVQRAALSYEFFLSFTFKELEELIMKSRTREERAYFRALLNLKLQLEQEKIVGKELL